MDGIETSATAMLRGFPLACPRDGESLYAEGAALRCHRCGTCFPVVGGVPVLIDDEASAFAIADYQSGDGYTGPSYGREADRASGVRRLYRRVARWLGDTGSSIRHPDPADALAYVAASRPNPRVLVIGSGGLRFGGVDDHVLHSDVAFGPAVDAIADAHGLPFPDGVFDLVVAVAVLEHVADPARCVAEIWRVLDQGGHVFAVTPFLQPVHMGAYDFTRFTPIGHRRLFRRFDEVAAGVAMGIGSVTAWTFGALLQSVSPGRRWRLIARGFGLLCTPPLRLLDGLLRHGADAAGGCWFFGRRRDGAPVSDRALVGTYHAQFAHGPERLPAPDA
ncbi:methyltransferase family protein [Humitalea rosea]|uniref:Methyltransferase family protein n=1 Tax=Humitalea rosea TaxID=990373 RepID=A0A2W7J514_9PROT|nr:methyltransferase domain-containing protein [Humitalea rosea]PZW46766.1 methyltransferase family protein [Humitalea rosea]